MKKLSNTLVESQEGHRPPASLFKNDWMIDHYDHLTLKEQDDFVNCFSDVPNLPNYVTHLLT